MKFVIISGSSRSNGNTSKIVHELQHLLEAEVINLHTKNISAFDYEHKNRDDDFLPMMRTLVDSDTLIFVSPVYWYSMSGTMKIFFDRISDCLKIEKETGRKLRGMNLAVVSVGSDDEVYPGFFMPFEKSAEYLGMNYLAELHTWIEHHEIPEEVMNKLQIFANKIKLSAVALNNN